MTVGERIKAARAAIGLSQPETAERTGIPVGTLRKYEQGPSLPGAEAIAGFVRAGINANWLLTGEGPMLLSELDEMAAWRARAEQLQAEHDALAARLEGIQGVPLNEAAMRAIITGIIEAHRGRDVPADYVASRAVDLYRKALHEALITPTGIGEGKNKSA